MPEGYRPRSGSGEFSEDNFVLADIGDAVKARANDEALEKSTESTDQPRGFWNRIKNFGKTVWKRSEIFQTRERYKAESRMQLTGVVLGATKEEHDREALAITNRFAAKQEFEDEFIHKAAGESRERLGNSEAEVGIKTQLQDLIRSYARGNTTEGDFHQAKETIFANIHGLKPQALGKGKMYADNLFAIARDAKEYVRRQVEQSMDHEMAVRNLDLDFGVVIGKAKAGVRTEAQFNAVDRIVDKIQRGTGGLFNEKTVAVGVAIANTFFKKVVQGSVRQAATYFGLGMAASGAVAAGKESRKIEVERMQHARETAQGKKIKNPSLAKRREELEASRIQTKSVKDLERGLQTSLFDKLARKETKDLTEAEYKEALKSLSDIDTRIFVSDFGIQKNPKTSKWQFWRSNQLHKVDLIGYSDITKVDQERFGLDLLRFKAKQELKKWALLNGRDFAANLNDANLGMRQEVFGGEKGITKQNEVFHELKQQRVWTAFKRGALIGGAIGLAMQEAYAFHDDTSYGALEHLKDNLLGHQHIYTPELDKFGHLIPEHNTLLEGIHKRATEYFNHAEHGPDFSNLHEQIVNGHHFKLPDGMTMRETPGHHGWIIFDHDGSAITDPFKINPDGTLPVDTQTYLEAHGFGPHPEMGPGAAGGAGHAMTLEETEAKFPGLARHPRGEWHDNPGSEYVAKFHKWLEHEGKQQNMYLEKDADGTVYVNVKTMLHNLKMNLRENLDDPKFGLNPDGTIDQKLIHQTNELLNAAQDGTLEDQFQVAIIPTEAANHAGLSLLYEGAVHGRVALPPEISAQFTDESMLHEGHTPFAFMETRWDADPYATVQGVDAHMPTEVPYFIFGRPPTDFITVPPPIIPWSNREGLGEMKRRRQIGPHEYYYGSQSPEEILENFRKRNIPRESYLIEQRDGKRHLVDAQGGEIHRDTERERERIEIYLASQTSEFLAELERLNQSLPAMSEKCRVAICAPARFEGPGLDNFLEQMSKQTDGHGNPISLDMFEINIIVNKKDSETADNSIEVLNKWMQQHPEAHVNVIDVSFPDDKACVGLARKYITDLALLRSVKRAKQDGSLYIESHDADMFGVDKRLVWKLTKDFDAKAEIDMLRGVQDRRPEIMQKNDMLFFRTRLWDFMENVLRNPKYRPDVNSDADFRWHRVTSGGTNSAFTAEVYSQIGGYDGSAKMGEDIDIGSRILMLRSFEDASGRTIPNTWTSKASGIRDSTSPRRFIDAFARNVEAYNPQEFENQALKFKSLEDLLKPVERYAVAKPEHLQDYEDYINQTFGLLKSIYQDSPEWKKVANRVMFFAGLKEGEHYTIGDTVTLLPEGLKQIAKTFQEYRDTNKSELGYRRQNAPLNYTEPRPQPENHIVPPNEPEPSSADDGIWDDESFRLVPRTSTVATPAVESTPAPQTQESVSTTASSPPPQPEVRPVAPPPFAELKPDIVTAQARVELPPKLKSSFEANPLSFIYGRDLNTVKQSGISRDNLTDGVRALYRLDDSEFAQIQTQAASMPPNRSGRVQQELALIIRAASKKDPSILASIKGSGDYNRWVTDVVSFEAKNLLDNRTLTNDEINKMATEFGVESDRIVNIALSTNKGLQAEALRLIRMTRPQNDETTRTVQRQVLEGFQAGRLTQNYLDANLAASKSRTRPAPTVT